MGESLEAGERESAPRKKLEGIVFLKTSEKRRGQSVGICPQGGEGRADSQRPCLRGSPFQECEKEGSSTEKEGHRKKGLKEVDESSE